jgi:hypothetical protein
MADLCAVLAMAGGTRTLGCHGGIFAERREKFFTSLMVLTIACSLERSDRGFRRHVDAAF